MKVAWFQLTLLLTSLTPGLFTARAQPYQFTTVAGDINFGSGKADGTNTAAQFSQPAGIVVDQAGTFYLGDLGNNEIRMMTAGGTIYVCENFTHRIRKLRFSVSRWLVSNVVGNGTSGTADGTNTDARFYLPNGIAVDAQTNLYVADTYNNAIRQISPVGTNWVVTTIAGFATNSGYTLDGTNNNARFLQPLGIVLDPYGNLICL